MKKYVVYENSCILEYEKPLKNGYTADINLSQFSDNSKILAEFETEAEARRFLAKMGVSTIERISGMPYFTEWYIMEEVDEKDFNVIEYSNITLSTILGSPDIKDEIIDYIIDKIDDIVNYGSNGNNIDIWYNLEDRKITEGMRGNRYDNIYCFTINSQAIAEEGNVDYDVRYYHIEDNLFMRAE